MDFEEQVEEATHVITSLWPLSAVTEVAELGIVTQLFEGEAAIVSSDNGEVLWCGGRVLGLPWALAFLTAAKNVREQCKVPG